MTGPDAESIGAVVVAQTGHRHDRFDAVQLSSVSEQVGRALEAIEGAFPGSTFRLVTGLASGSDSLAADRALERGWTLQAVLPAPRAVYERDFDPQQVEALGRRLGKAEAVFELPGEPGRLDGPHYERAGRTMLDQCDLLLAVWDGRPARGRGGTAQIVAEALERGLPVLHLDPDTGATAQVMWTGFDALRLGTSDSHGVARAPLEGLGLVVRPAAPGACDDKGAARSDLVGWSPLHIVYPLFLAGLGVRRLRLNDFRTQEITPLKATARSEEGGRTQTSFDRAFLQRLVPAYQSADQRATRWAQLHRGAFVLNFALSALAVVFGLSGLLVGFTPRWLLTLGEVVVVLAIVQLTHLGQRRKWHERWIEERLLAERLRGLILSAPLGDVSLAQVRTAHPRIDSTLRTLARALGLPSTRVDDAYLQRSKLRIQEQLQEQVLYNRLTAERMHVAERRLERVGLGLFVTGAGLSVLVLMLEIAPSAWLMDGLHRIIPTMSAVGTVASGVLPAIGAAIFGVRIQSDFAGASLRSRTLASTLSPLLEVATGLDCRDEEATFDLLRSLARRATEAMGGELTSWRSVHSARPLALPG